MPSLVALALATFACAAIADQRASCPSDGDACTMETRSGEAAPATRSSTNGASLLQKRGTTLAKSAVIDIEEDESEAIEKVDEEAWEEHQKDLLEASQLREQAAALRKQAASMEEEANQVLHDAPVFLTRDDIPSGCVLPERERLPDGAKCVFSDQCVANRCCPYLKVCNPPLSSAQVRADPMLKAIMWSAAYGGASTCGEQFCDVCPFRGERDAYQCNEINGGPVLKGSTYAGMLPFWNTEDEACHCDSRFQAAMEDGSWVPACPKVTASKAASTPAPTKKKSKKGKKAKRTPAPAPQGGCTNSVVYKDPSHQMGCDKWMHYECAGHSFSDELSTNCPCSCGACDSETWKDPSWGDGCKAWTGYTCTGLAFSDDLIKNCPLACRACDA